MLAHFVRRILGGFAQLWIVLFIISYVVMGLPIGPTEAGECPVCWGPTPTASTEFLEKTAYSDKPWPLSYVDWLFDPEATTTPAYDANAKPLPQRPKGVDISLGPLQIKGSGALTGDLGPSLDIDLGIPVSDMFGPGIGETFTFLITLIAALMLIVTLQRWRRPPPYRPSTLPTSSALIDWHYQHSTSHLDTAILKRYWQ